jgi:hypothetical protein
MRVSRRFGAAFAVVVAVSAVALSACGGSSSKANPPAGGASTSSAPSSTTGVGSATATAPVPEAAAARAAVQAADVGSGFTPYREAGGLVAVGAQSCSATAPDAVLTTRDHLYSGPMFKKNDAKYFAYSEVYVFRNEQLARRYATFRSTAAFQQCKQRQDDATTREAQPDAYVALTPVSYPNASGHIPTMYRELTGSTSRGKRVDGGFYDRYTVVSGPVVVVVSIDSELARNDESSAALARQTGDILRHLDTTLAGRVAALQQP